MANGTSNALSLVVGALFLAVLVGVVFSYLYPTIGASTELGLLFAVVGLASSLVVRAIWRRLRSRRHAAAREA